MILDVNRRVAVYNLLLWKGALHIICISLGGPPWFRLSPASPGLPRRLGKHSTACRRSTVDPKGQSDKVIREKIGTRAMDWPRMIQFWQYGLLVKISRGLRAFNTPPLSGALLSLIHI